MEFKDIMKEERQLRLKEEKFFEQIFNKTHRLFYHISDKSFDKFKLSFHYLGVNQKVGAVFLSPDKEFVKSFYKGKFTQRRAFLYTCLLKRKLDLFNLDLNKDYSIIEKELSKEDEDKLIPELTNNNHRDALIMEQQPRIIELAKKNMVMME